MKCENCNHAILWLPKAKCWTHKRAVYLVGSETTNGVIIQRIDECRDCGCEKPEASRGESAVSFSKVFCRSKKASRNPESFQKPKEFCETCYHNKEAHTFGACAYCNCKEFKEKKKEGLPDWAENYLGDLKNEKKKASLTPGEQIEQYVKETVKEVLEKKKEGLK
jgi:hypothetical protein